MPNPTIGTVICPLLGDMAEVRQDKNRKLYYVGKAGIISPKSFDGQQWLKEHAKLDGQDEPTPIEEAPPKPEELDREPTAKGGGIFDGIFGDIGELI